MVQKEIKFDRKLIKLSSPRMTNLVNSFGYWYNDEITLDAISYIRGRLGAGKKYRKILFDNRIKKWKHPTYT